MALRPGPVPGRRVLPWMLLVCAGCEWPSLFAGDNAGAVHILDVEGLRSPAVPTANLYEIERTFPVSPEDPSRGQATGFFMRVVTSDAARLRMRLVHEAGHESAELHRVAAPAAAGEGDAWALPAEIQEILASGTGAFFFTDPRRFGAVEHRLGVVLPDTWSGASVRLEVYADVTPAGAPISGDRIELARSFYYMAALGDSVVWGNGLPEPQKFTRIVAEEIQRRTGRRVVREVHAISGSKIVPAPDDAICPVSCNGEVPMANTPILLQAELLAAPSHLDLVLVDGCINDVGVTNILNPETDDLLLAQWTQSACRDAMGALLGKLRTAAPQAVIVVTGYYPIVSSETRVPELSQFLGSQDQETDEEGADLVLQAAEQSRIFAQAAHASIDAAVRELAAQAQSPVILFVDPEFSEQNALFASQPLLWGLTANRIQTAAANEGLTLFPEDPIAHLRATGCFRPYVLADPITCLYASVGHPNPAGAQRYAARILSALEAEGLIPPGGP